MSIDSGSVNPIVELLQSFSGNDLDFFIRNALAMLVGGIPLIAGLWVASIFLNQVQENRRSSELKRLRKLQRRFGEYNVRPKYRSNGHRKNNHTRNMFHEIKKPTRGGRFDRYMRR